MKTNYFSESYSEAKKQFRNLVSAAGGKLISYPIGNQTGDSDELTIDVAILGNEGEPTLVTSSGVHGVEGFMGSAVQLALLDELAVQGTDGIRQVLIHAVNPFGFAYLRRFTEDNVDLNRNFLDDAVSYRGAPPHYQRLNGFLNPESPPSSLEPFLIKAMWNIWKYGLHALRQSIAGGQYEFPRGIFFGGNGPAHSTETVRRHIETWIGPAQEIVHLDFHSGLGAFGEYKLLLAEPQGSEEHHWYNRTFGETFVEATEAERGTAYQASGPMGEWLQKHFSSRNYRFATAEFGTYGSVRVVAAIRAENRAHHYGEQNSSSLRKAKQELLECFCPRNNAWRQKVVSSGLQIVRQGIKSLQVQ